MKSNFGIKDYRLMYKKYGIKLPYVYFYENHLFDIINKVDTHKRLTKDNYKEIPKNFEFGIMYMSSFKSVINESIKFIYNLDEDFEKMNLVDLGCGKGKVILVWKNFLTKNRLTNNIIGVEYNNSLLSICKNNIKQKKSIELLNIDVSDLSNKLLSKKNVYYLFNPFNEVIIEELLKKINKSSYIIYNNPVHIKVFLDFGYSKLIEKKGFHPNKDWVVLKYSC